MVNEFNKLLVRQVKRHYGSIENIPDNLKEIIQDINNTYNNFDDDAHLLQNSIEISSQELREAYQKQKKDAESQKETIYKIKEAINALNSTEIDGKAKNGNTYSDTANLFDSLIKLIEERKMAMNEILKLSKAVEQNPASIVITDINGDIEYVNTKFCNLTGYTKEEVIGKNPRILNSDTTPKEYFTNLWQTILLGNEWNGELQNKKKNGEFYWESALIAPIINDNKIITHFIAIKEDITERKLAETEKLRQSGLITSLLDSIPDFIFFKDINGVYLGCNPSFAEFVGKSKNEIIGKTDYDLFDKEIADFFRFNDNEMLSKKQSRNNEEWISYPDGRKILIDTLKTPYWASDGSLIGLLGISRDITKRKEAEEELRLSSQKFEAIISASPDGIGMASLDGKIQLMSEKLALIHGYPLEEKDKNLDKTIYDFIDASDHAILKENIQKLLIGEKSKKISEYLALRKDNTKFNVDVNSSILLDSNGNPSSILFVERDITERKLAEEEIKRHAGLISSLLDSIPDIIFFKDINGVYLGGNPAFFEYTGKTRDEVIGKTDFDFFEKETAISFIEQDKQILKSGIPKHNDLWITYPDGHKILVDTLKTPYFGTDGSVMGVLGISRNITERKMAEEALKQISTRLALATRAGGVGVWEFDIVNKILLWDEQMFEIYGVKKNEKGNAYKTWRKSIHPDDVNRNDTEIDLAVKGIKEFDTEYRIVWPNGSIHNVRVLATVQRDETGNQIRMIGTNWDITEQKKNEAVLLNAKLEAEMANKSKSLFLANMSHEIRTPLNAIIGFSQLMNRDTELSNVQKDYITSIIRAGEHLLTLINNILELSKVEAGRIILNSGNVDLYALIEDIQMIFKERVEYKHLQFIIEKANDLPRIIFVDEHKLRQIMINLIGNAIKFTDEGGIAIRVRVDKNNNEFSKLVVEIQDSGCGIAENELSKLYKHFVQTSSGIKKSSGTGLGLALSRELAILMGGDISVNSTLGKGSIFTFNVKIKEGNLEDIQDVSKQRVKCIEKGQKAFRILVVDDKNENLQVAVRLLELVGFQTQEAVDGKEAIIKFEEWNPDLILMDMRMPVMDGYEATRLIKLTKKGKLTPIIALTASSFEDERSRVETLDIQGYIRKPFRENELFNIIGKTLGIKYIYEDLALLKKKNYQNNTQTIFDDINKLSDELIVKMLDSIAVADIDLLIELINSFESENSELAEYLKMLANNYNYDYLQQLFKKRLK